MKKNSKQIKQNQNKLIDTDMDTDHWLPEAKWGGRVKWVKGSNVW